MAVNAAKPRGCTLAFSKDAPVTEPTLGLHSKAHNVNPWREDDISSSFHHIHRGGEGGGGELLLQSINASLDMENLKHGTRESIQILQQGGIGGIGGSSQVNQGKGPWRNRPRPEWERPWENTKHKKHVNNVDGVSGVNGVLAVVSGQEEDHKLNRSKFAHYINSWDAPLSHLIHAEEPEEEEVQTKQDEHSSHPSSPKKTHGKSKQHPIEIDARFSQPTEAWILRQEQSQTHNQTQQHSQKYSQHHSHGVNEEVSKRPIGGGAPSFGMPYHSSNHTSGSKGKHLQDEHGVVSSPSRRKERETPPISPTHRDRSHQSSYQLQQNSQQAHQLQQQQEHYQKQSQQQQQQLQQHQQPQQPEQQQPYQHQQHHQQPQSQSYSYIAKDASTEIGYRVGGYREEQRREEGRSMTRSKVETKTRSTSPFDESVLRQVYPSHGHHEGRVGGGFHTRRPPSSPWLVPPPRRQGLPLVDMQGLGTTDLNTLVSAMSGLMTGASEMMMEYRGTEVFI